VERPTASTAQRSPGEAHHALQQYGTRSRTRRSARARAVLAPSPFLSAIELLSDFAQLARLVIPAEIGPTVTGDPDDDQVLACALAAEAQVIVSGDKRLRNLKTYQRMPIVGAGEALAMIQQAT